jgi:hypothetical protein
MILLPFRHPHPVQPQPSHSPSWRTHLRDEDLGAVLAALGAEDDAVPVHLVEQALPSGDDADNAEASARWCLEVLATLEPRPHPAEEPPWPTWRGVGAGGTVHPRPHPAPHPGRSRGGLLPGLGTGANQRGAVVFLPGPAAVQLLAPADVVARLEARCGASFASARAPWLDPGLAERAAWRAAGLEVPVAYWWPPDTCPILARVWAAIVWRPDAASCAWLWWPDGAPVMAPSILRQSAGLPRAEEDAALAKAIRAVLGLMAAGGRPPGSVLGRRFPSSRDFRHAYQRYAQEFIAEVGQLPMQADFADFLGVSVDTLQRFLKQRGLSWPPEDAGG